MACEEEGEVKVADRFAESFRCDSFEERETIDPPKDNVMVVLSGSGRDFIFRDDSIKSIDDIRQIMGAGSDYIYLGGFIFKTDDIAAIKYLEGGEGEPWHY